jgi:hypothetical protein
LQDKDKIELKVNKVADHIFAYIWACILNWIGTHVTISISSRKFSIKLSSVVQFCGISKKEAKQFLLENRVEHEVFSRNLEEEKKLAQEQEIAAKQQQAIAAYQEKIDTIQKLISELDSLKTKMDPAIEKILELATAEKNYECYLETNPTKYHRENSKISSQACKVKYKHDELTNLVFSIKKENDIFENPNVEKFSDFKKIEELNNFSKRVRTVDVLIILVSVHLESMLDIQTANEKHEAAFMIETSKKKMGVRLAAQAEEFGKIGLCNYMEEKEIEAITANWKLYAKGPATGTLWTVPDLKAESATPIFIKIEG